MAIDVLGHAVDLKIGPVLQRVQADGACKGGVHAHDCACRMGDLGDGIQIADPGGRVARCLNVDEPGIGTHGGTDGLCICGIQQGHFNVVFLRQILTEQEIGCAVAYLGYDSMIPAVEEGREHCGKCGNTACKDRPVFRAGQRAKLVLKNHLVDVAVALVDVAVRSAPVHGRAVGGDAVIGGPSPQNDTPETRGEVKATRTYTIQNAMENTVTELYVYPSENSERGENLAGDGLESGESVEVTVTGYMLRTENETLYTIEYVVGNKLYGHRSLHVEDLLFETPINLVGVDGVTSATFVSFGNSNLA